jgi:hypothetical protein
MFIAAISFLICLVYSGSVVFDAAFFVLLRVVSGFGFSAVTTNYTNHTKQLVTFTSLLRQFAPK